VYRRHIVHNICAKFHQCRISWALSTARQDIVNMRDKSFGNVDARAIENQKGGHGGIWTHDLLITSQPLCQAELHDLVLAILVVHN
jgi:hypothetical protein